MQIKTLDRTIEILLVYDFLMQNCHKTQKNITESKKKNNNNLALNEI